MSWFGRGAATRTKAIVGRGDGTRRLRQLNIASCPAQPELGRRLHLAGRRPFEAKRKESFGAGRRWRGDQDQVDSRRENVCACSSAVGEYATSKFSNFSEKGKLTFCVVSRNVCQTISRLYPPLARIPGFSGSRWFEKVYESNQFIDS